MENNILESWSWLSPTLTSNNNSFYLYQTGLRAPQAYS